MRFGGGRDGVSNFKTNTQVEIQMSKSVHIKLAALRFHRHEQSGGQPLAFLVGIRLGIRAAASVRVSSPGPLLGSGRSGALNQAPGARSV